MTALRPFLALLALALSLGASAAAMPRFDKLEETLKIRPEQKEQFDAAVGATQRAMVGLALSAMQLKERLSDELMKGRPDLGALVDAQDQLIKAAREEWRKLYGLLDDEQVQIAKDYLRNQLGRLLQSQIAP